jgi:transcriptional regulator with XRE-family HTH domain
MARAAMLRGNFADALNIADAAIARWERTQSTEIENARVVRGLACVLGSDVDEGAAEVVVAASRLVELGSRLDAARAYRELGEALLQRDRTEQAISALRHAADCAGARSSAIRRSVVPVRVSD